MKIQTFVPTYRNTDTMCLQYIEQAIAKAVTDGGHTIAKYTHAGALVDVSRNNCIARYVRPDSDFVLFIDDDMKPEPDAINKIVALNRPIVSALMTTRMEPVSLALKKWNGENPGFSNWDDYPPTSIIEGEYAVGAAFLCIRMDALSTIVAYYLDAWDWMDWNRLMFDRLKVRSEYRQAERVRRSDLRRKNLKERGELRVFETEVHDGSEKRLGEDLVFSWKAIQCKIPITVDPSIRVTHTGSRDYSVEDFIPSKHYQMMGETPESLGLAEVLA